MTTNPTGPELFSSSASHLTDIVEGDAEYVSATNTHVDNRLLYATIAAASATQAQAAALVMLTEVIASATGTDHDDLDAWRLAIPGEAPWTTVTFEVDGSAVRDGEEGETWEATYRVPQHLADASPDMTEATAEQYSRPTHRRLARKPKPKHVLLPVGTKVLVSNAHEGGCTCADTQPWVGKIAGYDLHKSKYQVNEERYGSPGEYYDHVRWVFADNRVQPLDEQPEPEDPMAWNGPLGMLLRTFQRKWSCGVFDSGRHNGVHCTESDPHGGWGCGYRWKFPAMTDDQARRIGLITDSTKDDG